MRSTLSSVALRLSRWPLGAPSSAAAERCATGLHRAGLPIWHPQRALSSSPAAVRNPLLDVEAITTDVDARETASEARGIANVKDLPVSPKKLRHVANLAQGLYWREAMLQLEFCRKNIAVFVKNAIAEAARNAQEQHGLDPTHLVVHVASVGKGTYRKGLDYKSKGRVGVRKKYAAHLYVVLQQVSTEEIERTRFYGRWRATSKLLGSSWEERVRSLPRYRPVPGYEPGEPARVRPALAAEPTEGAGVRPSKTPRRADRPKGLRGPPMVRIAR